jgi:hypothetical protein
MSYYYNYAIGYIFDDKIYPLGPYTAEGKLKDVVSKSASFASDLHEMFSTVPDEKISEELRKEFSYKNWKGEEVMQTVRYLPVSELPSGDFIKKGYFLIDDVVAYHKDEVPYDFDGFYEWLSPEAYAAKVQNELKFGAPKTRKNDFGEEYTPHSVADYMYFAYPVYNCKEYEAFCLRLVADILDPYEHMLDPYGLSLKKGAKLVVLETEG